DDLPHRHRAGGPRPRGRLRAESAHLDRAVHGGRRPGDRAAAGPPATAPVHLHFCRGGHHPVAAAHAARAGREHQRGAAVDPAGALSFQPAEVAKTFLAIFFAGYLVSTRDVLTLAGPKFLGLQLPRLRDLGPLVLAWAGAILILVAQRDLGTSLMFFGLFVAVVYVATERVSWILIGLVMFAIGALAAIWAFPHVAERF